MAGCVCAGSEWAVRGQGGDPLTLPVSGGDGTDLDSAGETDLDAAQPAAESAGPADGASSQQQQQQPDLLTGSPVTVTTITNPFSASAGTNGTAASNPFRAGFSATNPFRDETSTSHSTAATSLAPSASITSHSGNRNGQISPLTLQTSTSSSLNTSLSSPRSPATTGSHNINNNLVASLKSEAAAVAAAQSRLMSAGQNGVGGSGHNSPGQVSNSSNESNSGNDLLNTSGTSIGVSVAGETRCMAALRRER